MYLYKDICLHIHSYVARAILKRNPKKGDHPKSQIMSTEHLLWNAPLAIS